MVNVCVTGGLKKDRELIDDIVWWCKDMLLPRHRVIDIEVKLIKTFEEGAEGFCYRGGDDRDFHIEIDHRLSRTVSKEEFVEVVIHEMIHVWQGTTNRLVDKFKGGSHKQMWMCKDGKYRNYTETKYEKQPWEVEAYKMSSPLTKHYMEQEL